jgi:hypothetical protein
MMSLKEPASILHPTLPIQLISDAPLGIGTLKNVWHAQKDGHSTPQTYVCQLQTKLLLTI